MLNTKFSPWPCYTEEEADLIHALLLSNKVNYWTGNECREFEKEFAGWVGVNYSVAVANGTLALDLALKALCIGFGDEVIVTPRTYIASVSCIINAGATPVFADVSLESGNITAESIEAVLTSRTKAIICVHLAGWPCDMDPIMELARKHELKVIEDCAQAHGAHYKGRRVGSIGNVGAWSFCQDKIMSTGGEGGMVTTNDPDLWDKMWSYKDHGKSFQAVYQKNSTSGFRWLHESFGTNWRMLELQAAIGRIQLRRMSEWSRIRRENSEMLISALRPFSHESGPIRLPRICAANSQAHPIDNWVDSDSMHAYYKFYVYARPENLVHGWTRDRIIEEINQLQVPCYQGTCSEVYLEKAFDNTNYRPSKRLPVARELGETSLMFLVHPSLTTIEMQETCDAIVSVLSEAARIKFANSQTT